MTSAQPGTQEWLDLVVEDVIEPDLSIVDPHHHLWPPGAGMRYAIDDLHTDTGDGHRVEHTVFVECRASYRTDGRADLLPVGETEFVAGVAASDPSGLIAGIVAHADLRLESLDEVLDAHEAAGRGLFRGIRHALSRADGTAKLAIPGHAPEGLFADVAFRRGVARLGQRGLTYDSWQYHHQAQEFLSLARAVPGTTMVLDHLSTPLGVGPFADQREEIFTTWKADMAEIATCPNVVAKLGGMAMPDNGFGWHQAERPATSDEFVAAQGRYYEHMIECFGPQRCMFESNFPVDRTALSYRTVWNAFKKIAAGLSSADKDALFSGTASRIYRVGREDSDVDHP